MRRGALKRFRRRFRPRPLTTRRKVTYSLIAALPVVAVFVFGSRGLLKRAELELEYKSLHSQLYNERSIGDSLRREITRIATDSVTIEHLARERFGMVRQGETVYRVVE